MSATLVGAANIDAQRAILEQSGVDSGLVSFAIPADRALVASESVLTWVSLLLGCSPSPHNPKTTKIESTVGDRWKKTVEPTPTDPTGEDNDGEGGDDDDDDDTDVDQE